MGSGPSHVPWVSRSPCFARQSRSATAAMAATGGVALVRQKTARKAAHVFLQSAAWFAPSPLSEVLRARRTHSLDCARLPAPLTVPLSVGMELMELPSPCAVTTTRPHESARSHSACTVDTHSHAVARRACRAGTRQLGAARACALPAWARACRHGAQRADGAQRVHGVERLKGGVAIHAAHSAHPHATLVPHPPPQACPCQAVCCDPSRAGLGPLAQRALSLRAAASAAWRHGIITRVAGPGTSDARPGIRVAQGLLSISCVAKLSLCSVRSLFASQPGGTSSPATRGLTTLESTP